MKWISDKFLYAGISLCFALWVQPLGAATPSSFRLPHPLGWMHSLPVGEMPGWSSSFWIHSETSWSNIWNAPVDLYNVRNGKILTYSADYEQLSQIIEMGAALNSYLAFSVEVPYAFRSGGVMDQFIDNFHIKIGSDRFNRPDYPFDQSRYSVQSDGVEQLASDNTEGVDHLKYKLKLWWLQWQSRKKGVCDCGFATSVQVKTPLSSYEQGLTSGEIDTSIVSHLGIPLFGQSALWMTYATTFLGENQIFKDWPLRRQLHMYEASFDFALNDRWGFLLQIRAESPLMYKDDLRIVDYGGSSREKLMARIASGWNSLVYWRGSEGFGLRYRHSPTGGINLLLVEDWGFGKYDGRGDNLYVNNAPDVTFVLQTYMGF